VGKIWIRIPKSIAHIQIVRIRLNDFQLKENTPSREPHKLCASITKLLIMAGKLAAATASFTSDIIVLDLNDLGLTIAGLIQDVGQLNVVTIGDLKVYGSADGAAPKDVREAVMWGTKLFDALYYFALESARRPVTKAGKDGSADIGKTVVTAKKRLLWAALFIMLRGAYPESKTGTLGADVPAFLKNICGMVETPAATAEALASFPLTNINPGWVRAIKWDVMAPAIRQRLALGLAGYRALGPFRYYPCKPGVSKEVQDAYDWVEVVCSKAPDYAILSATRSATMIAKLGSWNHALGNLALECFTDAQLTEMVTIRLIFAKPTADPRYASWRSWVAGGELVLNDPIGL